MQLDVQIKAEMCCVQVSVCLGVAERCWVSTVLSEC